MRMEQKWPDTLRAATPPPTPTVHVSPTAPSSVVNRAQFTASEANRANDTASDPTTVRPPG